MVLPKVKPWIKWIKYATAIALLALDFMLINRAIPINYFNNHVITTQWQNIATNRELQNSLKIASQKNQYTILEFYASWCTSCKKLEQDVFTNNKMQTALEKFNLLRVDITNLTDEKSVLLHSLQIYGPPAILFFDPAGKELKSKRVVGDVNKSEMLKLIQSLK